MCGKHCCSLIGEKNDETRDRKKDSFLTLDDDDISRDIYSSIAIAQILLWTSQRW